VALHQEIGKSLLQPDIKPVFHRIVQQIEEARK